MKKLILAAGVAATLGTAGVMAATDGTIGATSTGDLLITLQTSATAIITGMTDITLDSSGWTTGDGDLVGNDDFCIGSNSGTAVFDVTISGDGVASAFTVDNGGTPVPYSVNLYPQSGLGGTAVPATAAVLIDDFTVSAASNLACGAANASVDVTFAEADLLAISAAGSDHTGTLTFLVAPQ